jgi:hypothetical protein
MKSEKVELSTEATSYVIEVDTRDLSLEESLASRYARYFKMGYAEITPSPNVATNNTTAKSRNHQTIPPILSS